MVERTMGEARARFKKMQSSRGFQEYCWSLYRKHKDLIKENIRWRTFLHVKPGSQADAALAFLIDRTFKYHRVRWRGIIEKIMEEVIKLPPGMWETYLQIIVRKHEQKMIDELLAGQGKMHNSVEVLKRTRKQIGEFLEALERFMKKGRVSMLTGVPPDYMPEWYFVARPENEFYKSEALEEIVVPLIEKEKAKDRKKALALNELHELLAKHSWNRYFVNELRQLLRNLSHAIEGEIELRNRIERTGGVEAVRKLEIEVRKDLVKQRQFIVELQRLAQRNIPNKEIHAKVGKLLVWLLAEANKEIKS